MADFADTLIKNLGLHAAPRLSSSVNLTDRLGNLGDTLRYARSSLSLASLSQALIGSNNTATTATTATTTTTKSATDDKAASSKSHDSILPPAPEQAQGRLWINLTEARNLTVLDPTKADIYGLVQYDKNVMSTIDLPALGGDDTDKSPGQPIPIPNASTSGRHLDIFQLAMEASCPKWRYNANLYVYFLLFMLYACTDYV